MESINYSKGALIIEDTAVSIPGRNGMNIDVRYAYDSSTDYDEKEAKGTYMGCFRLQETKLLMGKVYPSLYKTEEGAEYTLKRRTPFDDEYWEVRYYPYKAPILRKDINQTVNNSKYVMEYPDERKEFFNDEGYLVGKQDKFGNTIIIKRVSNIITSITDTDSFSERKREVKITSVNSDINFEFPDGSNITYKKELDGNIGNKYVLTKTDQNGEKTEYRYTEIKDKNNICQNIITSVKYPTGMEAVYEYENGLKYKGEIGNLYYKRLKSKEYKIDGKVHNKKTYEYSNINYYGNEPKEPDDNYTKDKYEYSITEKEIKNKVLNSAKYTYDQRNFKIKEDTEGEVIINKVYEYDYVYDGDYYVKFQPVRIISQINGNVTAEIYEYDSMGYVENSWKSREYSWNSKSKPSISSYYYGKRDEEHKINTNYTEDGILAGRIYKKDRDTNIKEIGECEIGIIHSRLIYENGILKGKTEYTHDEYGNVTEEKRYTDNKKYDIKIIEYDRDGMYPIKVTENGIITEYSYDIMGRVTSVKDGKGNITKYEYNKSGDIICIVYADGSKAINEYDYKNNDMIVTNQNGSKVKYNYNPAGKLESITDLNTNIVKESREYNESLMTKTKIENGQLKTEYTYNGLDMVKDIITKDIKTQKELHHAVYEYSFGAENKIQRTIKGDEENRI